MKKFIMMSALCPTMLLLFAPVLANQSSMDLLLDNIGKEFKQLVNDIGVFKDVNGAIDVKFQENEEKSKIISQLGSRFANNVKTVKNLLNGVKNNNKVGSHEIKDFVRKYDPSHLLAPFFGSVRQTGQKYTINYPPESAPFTGKHAFDTSVAFVESLKKLVDTMREDSLASVMLKGVRREKQTKIQDLQREIAAIDQILRNRDKFQSAVLGAAEQLSNAQKMMENIPEAKVEKLQELEAEERMKRAQFIRVHHHLALARIGYTLQNAMQAATDMALIPLDENQKAQLPNLRAALELVLQLVQEKEDKENAETAKMVSAAAVEPSSSLDSTAATNFNELIAELREKKTTSLEWLWDSLHAKVEKLKKVYDEMFPETKQQVDQQEVNKIVSLFVYSNEQKKPKQE